MVIITQTFASFLIVAPIFVTIFFVIPLLSFGLSEMSLLS